MNYHEDKEKSKQFKEEYVSGLNRIIELRQKEAQLKRHEFCKNIFENQEFYREEFRKMLGWPLVEHFTQGLPEVKTEFLSQEDGYSIYRIHFGILPGLTLTGLFFKMGTDSPAPLVITQHGGQGTPELASGIHGDTFNYNNMIQRVINQKVHCFAPQLLLWADEYEVSYNRDVIDAQLKRVGSSITAVEVYGITRILDYFENQNYVSSFGMVGLSYGGFYTLYTSAIDTRIKAAVSSSIFYRRDEDPRIDMTWLNSAYKFDDAEIACLVYPRNLHLEMGDHDELFNYKHTLESFEFLKEHCKDVGTDWVDLVIFDGSHEFFKNDEPVINLVEILKNI